MVEIFEVSKEQKIVFQRKCLSKKNCEPSTKHEKAIQSIRSGQRR